MEKRCLFCNAKTINKPHCIRRMEVCFIYKDIRTKGQIKLSSNIKHQNIVEDRYAAVHRRQLSPYRQPTF